MKTWMEYSHYLLSGEWHIHTSYTDGNNSVDDYCKRAVELEIPLVAFTEHVRYDLDYDFNAFLEDIEIARERYDIIILSGCEAKVLPDATLDVDNNILKQIDYPIFAFHSFPRDLNLYIDALDNILNNSYINAWAHPCTFLNRSGLQLDEGELSRVFRKIHNSEVLIELNSKHNTPSDAWAKLARQHNVSLVRGSDCHCIEELHF